MVYSFIKAFRLELQSIVADQLGVALLFVAPFAVILVFAFIASGSVSDFHASLYSLPEGSRLFDYLNPILLAIVSYFFSIQLTVLRIVGERSPWGVLDRDLLALPRFSLYLGKLAANSFIAFLQSLAVVFAIFFLFNAFLRGSLVSVFLVFFGSMLLGISFGLFFSTLVKSRETAMQLVPLTVLVFLSLSGFLIEVKDMPSAVSSLSLITPMSLSFHAFSDLILWGKTLGAVIPSILLLVAWFFLINLLASLSFCLRDLK